MAWLTVLICFAYDSENLGTPVSLGWLILALAITGMGDLYCLGRGTLYPEPTFVALLLS